MFSPYFLGAQNAAFNNGKWAKIAISKQGIYQITGAQLKTLGFPLPITSAQLQLFNYNLAQLTEKVTATVSTALTENAIQVFDGGDNQIDEKDYVLFYAEGGEGGEGGDGGPGSWDPHHICPEPSAGPKGVQGSKGPIGNAGPDGKISPICKKIQGREEGDCAAFFEKNGFVF